MGFVGGGFADLTSYRIGNFLVDGVAGRNRTGQPIWDVVCNHCRMSQRFDHQTLSRALESGRAEEVVFCKNERCPNSKKNDVAESESLFEIRRQEREKRKLVDQQAAADRAKAEYEVAKIKAREARLASVRAEWNEYSNHQINAGTPLQEIASLSRWAELTNALRERIMTAIRSDPNARVTGLRR